VRGAVGTYVSEFSGEFVPAIEMGAVLEDIAGTIHVHPTLTEPFHELALRPWVTRSIWRAVDWD